MRSFVQLNAQMLSADFVGRYLRLMFRDNETVIKYFFVVASSAFYVNQIKLELKP